MARRGPIERALEEGHRPTLEALRRTLAARLDDPSTPPAYVAGMAGKLLDVETRLHELNDREAEAAEAVAAAALVPDEPL